MQEVELSAGDWRGALLYFCTSVCHLLLLLLLLVVLLLLLCESGLSGNGDLTDEMVL